MSQYNTFEERVEGLSDTIAYEIYDELNDKGIVAEVTATRRGVTVVPVMTWDDREEWPTLIAALQVARANVTYYLKEHTAAHISGQHIWAHIIGRPASDYKIEILTAPVSNVTEGEECGCNY